MCFYVLSETLSFLEQEMKKGLWKLSSEIKMELEMYIQYSVLLITFFCSVLWTFKEPCLAFFHYKGFDRFSFMKDEKFVILHAWYRFSVVGTDTDTALS
jgi:hypothetical protein